MTNPRSTMQIAGHPIHPMLVQFPIAFLIGTLVGDLAYRATGDQFWATLSYWLLAAALVMAALAAVVGLTDFLAEPRIRAVPASWRHMIGNVLAVVLSLFSFWLRYSGDVAAHPTVLWISIVVVLLLVYTGWQGGELVFQHRVGVSDDKL